jgi:hypothetical protein
MKTGLEGLLEKIAAPRLHPTKVRDLVHSLSNKADRWGLRGAGDLEHMLEQHTADRMFHVPKRRFDLPPDLPPILAPYQPPNKFDMNQWLLDQAHIMGR